MTRSLTAIARLLLAILAFAPLAPAQAFERPGAGSGPTVLRCGMTALDIEAVDSAQQSFTANIFLAVRWQDDRLAHEGPGVRVMSTTEAWAPQFQFANQQRVMRTFPEQLLVTPTGEVIYRQRLWGMFSQRLDLRDFPIDRQVFAVEVVATLPSVYSDQMVTVADETAHSGVATDLSIADWSVTDWSVKSTEYNPLGEPLGVPSFTLSFTAVRHAGYYMYKILLPLMLIVMMSWIVFWIDPKEMGTQISVSVTSMLTLIAYRFIVGGAVPKISYLTRLDLFILCATLLVFTTLLEAVITGTLARNERVEIAHKIDRVARVIYPIALAGVLYFTFVA